jgi:tetratricopeptide (TPR) repeat protein
MKKFLLLIVFLQIIFCKNLFAQSSDYDSLVTAGINQIYGIEFSKAEKTFSILKSDFPNHPAGRFFPAMIYWWKILLDISNEQYDDIFYEKIDGVIEFCDNLLEINPNDVDALFFKGGAIGFRGRLRVIRESWLQAASDGRDALPIVEQAAKLEPKNVDVQLGFGIYNYYASVIPNRYPIVKPLLLFFPEGDKELGIKQLKNTANNGKYGKIEARYFLMSLYSNYEKDNETAEFYSNQLVKAFPNNPIFERWRGRIAVKKSDWTVADSIFRNVLKKGDKNFPGYKTIKVKREAVYYIAYQYKNNGEYEEALKYFNKCADYCRKIDTEKESGFLVNSTLYIGTIYESQAKYDKAVKYYEDVLDMREYANSHTLAELYLKRIKNRKTRPRN